MPAPSRKPAESTRPWSPTSNAAIAGGAPLMPAGQLLLAGQSIVGNAAVASRAVDTPRRPTTRRAVARTKPPPAAEVKRQDRADTADRPDRSKPKADTSGRRSPGTDPKFRALKKDVATKKHVVGSSHPPATREAGAAQAAAVAPADDQEARGKAAHAEEMAKAEPKEFNKDAFVKAVQEAVAARAPKTLDDANKFGESGKADEVKQEVQGQVGEGKDASAKQIADTTAQAPQPAPDKKPVVPLAPDQLPARPAGPNPAQATPDQLPPAATDMSAGPEQVAQQMADAQVTEPQLARSNEPAFTEALADKKNLDKHAETAPKELHAGERRELNQVRTAAAAQGPRAMASMLGTRVAVGQQVSAGKTGAKSRDEEKRTKVTALLQEVFDKTKCDVEKILSDLDKKVDDQFTKGEKDARDKFTREYTLGIKEYKRKRYDWPWGKGQWLLDLVLPTPPEVDRIYQTARDNYLIALNQVITEIAGTVETELRRAKDRIAKGRKQLQEAVTKLPKDLKAIGQEATKDFESKFDDLKDTVNDKGTELVDTLATRYTEAVREIDKQIVEEKEKNKTLFEKAGDAMTGAINSILELKNMLMGVLRKAVTAISAIIKDPIGFLGNLVTAVGGGLKLFMKNVGKHMQQGLFAWLLGSATTAGLQLPSKFDVLGILTMIAALLGLTWPNLRSRIARKVPDEAITAAETAVPLVAAANKRGVAGMWDDLKTHVGDLKKDLISKLIAYLTPTIIIAGITWILSLLNPASAFVRACKMIIDIVRFIITQAAQIIEFVNAVLDAVIAIARGGSGGVPALVERALARSIPVLIGALAAILGIGGIAAKVKQIFQSLARPVNRAIDRVIDKIIALVKKLWAKPKSKFDKKKPKKSDEPSRPEGEKQLAAPRKKFEDARDEKHEIFFVNNEFRGALMIQSTRKQIKAYLKEWEAEITGVTDERTREEQLKAWNHAVGLTAQVEARKDALARRPAAAQAIYKFIVRQLAELAATLAVRKTLSDPPLPPPMLPPFVDGVLATPFKAMYINKKIKKGSAAGTNTGSTLRGWDYVQTSGFNVRYKTSWVKMHLLPAFLGGDAKDSNLVPARGFTNNPLFLRAVENPARKALDKKKTDPGFEQMVWYSVDVSFYATPEGFPKMIQVAWGGYDSASGRWTERSAAGTFSDRQDPPLPPSLDILRINKAGATLIKRCLGVSSADAGAIKAFVRRTPFRDVSHAVTAFPRLRAKLQNLYQAGRMRFD